MEDVTKTLGTRLELEQCSVGIIKAGCLAVVVCWSVLSRLKQRFVYDFSVARSFSVGVKMNRKLGNSLDDRLIMCRSNFFE